MVTGPKSDDTTIFFYHDYHLDSAAAVASSSSNNNNKNVIQRGTDKVKVKKHEIEWDVGTQSLLLFLLSALSIKNIREIQKFFRKFKFAVKSSNTVIHANTFSFTNWTLTQKYCFI